MLARYLDDVTQSTEGEGTRLRYEAEFDREGFLRLGGPLMRVLFQRVGADATRGMPAAIAEGLSHHR